MVEPPVVEDYRSKKNANDKAADGPGMRVEDQVVHASETGRRWPEFPTSGAARHAAEATA